MKQIYLELVFLDNLLLDFILLFFCCRISEKRVNFLRLLAGAAIGGLYSALALPLPWLTSPWIKIPVASLLCLPLGIRPFRLYLRRLLLFFLVSFLLGGILFAFLCTQNGYLIGSAQFPLLRYLLLGMCLLCVLAEFLARQTYPQPNRRYQLSFRLYGHTIWLQALVDTGNCLQDAGGGGVIVMERNALSKQLSAEELQKLYNPGEAQLPIRTFACSTATGSASLYAFAPEALTLHFHGRSYSIKAYIALGELSLPAPYNALLSPRLRLHPLHFSGHLPG